jgi:hypothetical protein
MKKRYLYLPLAAGILIPSLVIFFLQVFVAGISPIQSISDILHKQFASGHNLFLLMVWSFIPFGALIILAYVLNMKLNSLRLAGIFWGAFIAVTGYTLYGHISVWYPLYAHKGSSSTDVLSFLLIPFICLVLMAFGAMIGWGISYLPVLRKE